MVQSKSNPLVTIGLVLVGVAGGAIAGSLLFREAGPGTVVEAGDPTFGLGTGFAHLGFTALDGRDHTFAEYAAGGPLVILVRDVYCPVSRRYGPRTGRLAREYAERGVRFLHVNVSPLDTPEDMAGEVATYGLLGAYAADHAWRVAGALRVIATGEVFVLDAEGVLRYRGAIDDQYGIRFTKSEPRATYLRDALDQLLAGAEVAVPSTPPEGCYLATDVHEIEHHHDRTP